MSVGRRYILDANVFIQAHRTHYAFDICPGFWSALIKQYQASTVCSIDRIKEELTKAKDRLKEWVTDTLPADFFKETKDNNVVEAFGDMVKWVQGEHQFTPAAKAEFSSVADGWVVAYAHVNNLTVVTHEEYAPEAKRKVPLPNVCLEFDVEYCNMFDMLRDMKEQFILKKPKRKS